MAKLQLTMVTAERRLLDKTADMVIAPGGGGELGILPRHQPLITTLKPGELRVRDGGEETLYVVAGGFLEVRHAEVDGAPGSQVIVLADAAERAEDIDLERARAAAQRAQDTLASNARDVEATAAHAALLRALTRIRVGERRRRGGQQG